MLTHEGDADRGKWLWEAGIVEGATTLVWTKSKTPAGRAGVLRGYVCQTEGLSCSRR